MLAAQVEQKNGMTKDHGNGVMSSLFTKPHPTGMPGSGQFRICPRGREVTRVPTAKVGRYGESNRRD